MLNQTTTGVYSLGYLAGRHCHDAYQSLVDTVASSPLRFLSIGNAASGGASSSSMADLGESGDDGALPHLLFALPQQYGSWWVALIREDPVHVVIETVLIAFVVYMLVWRRYSQRAGEKREKLTDAERAELLREWKETGRAGLVPTTANADGNDGMTRIGTGVVVEKVHGSKMTILLDASRGRNVSSSSTSVNSSRRGAHSSRSKSPSASERQRMTVLNFATHDFLGMASSDDGDGISSADAGASVAAAAVASSSSSSAASAGASASPTDEAASTSLPTTSVKGAARAALARYGCGSCGPRGFYGTIDAHLDLEDAIADHMRTDGAIMYSDGASAATSTMAAFAKRGDLLVVDEAIYEALNTGVTLSRANVVYFRHNDVEDLRNVLERIRESDLRLKRNSADQRRFIVVEGLYKNRGTVPPLDEIAEIKAEFCYRLVVDESFSFGTLGPNGRGALEHFGLTPMVDAEIITLSLENSIGSIGGVCVGSEEVVDHQRLSGAGYCFSASAPPFLASAAIASLKRIRNNPALLERVRRNRDAMYHALRASSFPLEVVSDDLSAMIFLELPDQDADMSVEEQVQILDDIRDRCLRQGVAIVSTGDHVMGNLHSAPPPALRITVSAVHVEDEVKKAVQVLKDATVYVLGKR
mmetsp:Transcript_23476/g.67651  ORF Transcript_23476/g.67651 Transcript_23476/m.67651 type:complete len:645 (-) Transcript_23476:966-2900(-)